MAAGTFLQIDYSGASNVSLNNLVSGAGTLVKDGTGTVIVSAANSYSGGTAINAGRLGLNNGLALGTGGVTVNSGAELALGDVILANAVTGAGSVIKTSAGNTVLTGANSFSGGLELQGGNLTAASVGSLGSGTIATLGGTSLTVGNATNQTLANSLTGAGSLIKVGAGDLTLTNNTLTGGLVINGGRVLASSNPLSLGTGAVSVGAGAELVYTNAANATFANGLTGAGTFRKLGAGQLLFGNPFAVGHAGGGCGIGAAQCQSHRQRGDRQRGAARRHRAGDRQPDQQRHGGAGQFHRHADGAGQLHPQCRIGAGDRIRRCGQYRPAGRDRQCHAERRHAAVHFHRRGRGQRRHLPHHRRHADGDFRHGGNGRRGTAAGGDLSAQCRDHGPIGADRAAQHLQRAVAGRGGYRARLHRQPRRDRPAPRIGQSPVAERFRRLGQPQRLGHHAGL